MSTAPTLVTLEVEPFSHSDDPKMTGMRGVRLGAETGYRSIGVFAAEFPGVWVAESGDVEIDDVGRVPCDVAAAWFRAVADYLECGDRSVPRSSVDLDELVDIAAHLGTTPGVLVTAAEARDTAP